MKQEDSPTQSIPFLKKNRATLFYTLALAPLVLIIYYNAFSAIIPFYGFLLLLIKQQKLLDSKESPLTQKIIGLILIAISFLASYAVALIYPHVAFYGVGNYIVFLVGLFLIFFSLSTLKEAFSAFFLITAAASSTFIAEWLKPYLSPFANDYVHIVVNILRTLRIDANIYIMDNIPVVAYPSLSGQMMFSGFLYECMGVYSMLVFSILLVVILLEDPASMKTRLAYSITGLVGIFMMNILRSVTVFLANIYYGVKFGGDVHYVIGYALFSAWLIIFLYAYAKRQTTQEKITSLWNKILRKRNPTIKETPRIT